MKAKTKFLRMYDKLPVKAREQLTYNFYTNKPYSLTAVMYEVKTNSNLSSIMLSDLGFIDE